MRTTVDLPDSLMRDAKAKAALAGESLKVLFERAIAREVGASERGELPGRGTYPLVRSRRVGVDFTNEQLEDVLAADEVEHYSS